MYANIRVEVRREDDPNAVKLYYVWQIQPTSDNGTQLYLDDPDNESESPSPAGTVYLSPGIKWTAYADF